MNKVIIRQPGLQNYQYVHDAMVAFTDRRGADTTDEIWCLEHEPVFTLGLAASRNTCWTRVSFPCTRPTGAGR